MAELNKKYKILSREPRIVVFPEFVSKDEIDELLKTAADRWETSAVVNMEDASREVSSHRTGNMAEIPRENPIGAAIMARIAEITNTRVVQLEGLQVIKYGPGHEYKEHTDWFDYRVPGIRKVFKNGGQRRFSIIIGIQEAESGGETFFREIDFKYKVKPGEAFIFEDVRPDGLPDPKTVHSSLPVTAGEKIVCVCWIRERAFDGSEEPAAHISHKEEMQTIKRMRQEACTQDLPKFLNHYGCIIEIDSKPIIGPDGGISVDTQIKIKALDID